MAKGKNVLTTGDVAKICHVAPRTVSKWFDNGQLRGYRIPGRIMLADSNFKTASTLADILRLKAQYDVQIVRSNFETGSAIQKFTPHVLLISLLAEGIDAAAVCKGIRENEDLRTIKIIALVNNLSESESMALLQKGFDGYVPYSADAVEVIKRIEESIAIIY